MAKDFNLEPIKPDGGGRPPAAVSPTVFGIPRKAAIKGVSVVGLVGFIGWNYQSFISLRGGMWGLTASRVHLGLIWASLFCILLIVTTDKKWRFKTRWLLALIVPSLLVFAMDWWAPKPKPQIALDQRTEPTNQAETAPCIPKDPQYVPPRGPAIRVDGFQYEPSWRMCQGMSEQQRADCLCPNRLPYSLRALPPPEKSNFETEVTISKRCDPIYEARLFFRDVYTSTGTIEAGPYTAPVSHVALGVLELAYDRFSVVVKSSAPEDEIKVRILTASGLRLVCVNQDN